MTSPSTHVIVGASMAGATAATELREQGFDGRVVLVGTEAEAPYERPPLSKEYLRGEATREASLVHPPGFYEEQEIELRLGSTVTGIDLNASEAMLDDGERLPFDSLLLTTGATPRRLEVPGGELDGLHYLRTFADADALIAGMRDASRVVVVGGGWIGAEVAASARGRGLDVALVERAHVPLERVLGSEVGGIYAEIHRDHGVELLSDAAVEAFEGDGRVERVRLAGGRTLDCDLAVVGVGVVPNVQLAADAGLEVDNGVVTDERLQTSDARVFAAGDVANAWHPLYGTRIRVEHWANAGGQGPAAARSMLGGEQPYDAVPYFFSDQYEVGMEYAGHALRWDHVVFRGDPASREFIAFWILDGRVVAGMNLNVWDVTDPIQALIRAGQPVDVARLTDPEVDLSDLAPPTGQ
ncbi:MAG TPA: FAD-dependent oxidoreductase [Solirubrobacteraceae bacterium]|nr:FAD-dependent oxidoreductase [Solirubrobacteraceae bacterium]